MTWQAWAQLALYFAVLLALVKPLGSYMARVYEQEPILLEKPARLARAPHLPALRCAARL